MDRQVLKEELQLADRYLKEMINMGMLSSQGSGVKTAFRLLTNRENTRH